MTRCTLAIAAGKGGVGKSTLTAQLAFQLDAMGYKVGVLDADLYGPSIPKMIPITTPFGLNEASGMIEPAYAGDIAIISLSFWPEAEQGLFARAPIANGMILQMLQRVDWKGVDFLLVDFPPGTGDIQLTLLQQGGFDGAVVLTTPQQVATLDVEKTIRMFRSCEVPIYGIIENMSFFQLESGEKIYPFGANGGLNLSRAFNIPLWAKIPLDVELSGYADRGLFRKMPEIETAAEKIVDRTSGENAGIISIRRIELLGENKLQIIWSDGIVSEFVLAKLEKHCPCVLCAGKEKIEKKEVRASSVRLVGKYAVQIDFETGCNRGIYTLASLRENSHNSYSETDF